MYGRRLPRIDRLARQGERCGRCGNHRFRKRSGQIQPVRRHVRLYFWNFEISACSHRLTYMVRCSAYILNLADVIGHLFGVPMFAKFAGTRTEALLNSPLYQHLDDMHGGAISALTSIESMVDAACRSGGSFKADTDTDSPPEPRLRGNGTPDASGPDVGSSVPQPKPSAGAVVNSPDLPSNAVFRQKTPPPVIASGAGPSTRPPPIGSHAVTSAPSPVRPSVENDMVDPDPSDEQMTGAGDALTLMFGIFVDGVQLHGHGRATTTVIGVKCLDLPGFLANTDLACYVLSFIAGPKEPTILTEIMTIILKQFKTHEPMGCQDDKGVSCIEQCLGIPGFPGNPVV